MLDKEKYISVLRNVATFLEELPDKIEIPDLHADIENDLSVDLEWYARPSQLVEVKITIDSYIYAALIIDGKKTFKECGEGSLKSGIDKKLVKLIERVSCLMK